jgi:hypothetical protein
MTRKIKFANNAVSKLNASITALATTIPLMPGDGSKFPTLSAGEFFMATLIRSDGVQEVIKVTARSGDNLTATRAVEPVAGTQTAYNFAAGDRVEQRLTAGALGAELDRIEGAANCAVQNKSTDYTVTTADVGDLLRVNTGGGLRTITLPALSSLTDDFEVLIAKVTGDTNNVQIAAAGSDLINGNSTYLITAQYQSARLIADRVGLTWTVINSGNAGSNVVVDAFTASGASAAVTLSGDPGSKNNTTVIVGGVPQLKSTYTLSGTTLTLGGTPSAGTAIEVWWTTPNSIGVPSDGTVSTPKLADNAVTAAKLADNAVSTTAKIVDGIITLAKLATGFILPVSMGGTGLSVAMRAYLSGLGMSTAGSSTTMSIAAGMAADSTNAVLMNCASAISKTTSAWAAGTGNGGLDTGSIANNTWYHFHLIAKTDGTADVLFSLSPSSPTLPSGYSYSRRIGSGKTNGSAQWVKFIQDGDVFQWDAPVADVSTSSTAANRTLYTLSVPTGLRVQANVSVAHFSSVTATHTTLLTDPATADTAPGLGAFTICGSNQTSGASYGGMASVYTDTSARIGARSTFVNTLNINTHGWVDRRGRDA